MAMMWRPAVSVVMPVYNAGPWLSDAIESIRQQTFRQIELIIVDDGSTDSSWSVACRAAEQDHRVRIYRREHSGICAALNAAIAVAGASLIARMDADDVAQPRRLEKQKEFLDCNPSVAAAGTWADIIDEGGAWAGQLTPPTDPARLRKVLLHQNPFIHTSMMVRASILCKVGGYRDIVQGAEDYDLWLRISEHAELANIPECLVKHRRHSASATEREPTGQLIAARIARQAAVFRRTHRPDFIENLNPPLQLETLLEIPELRSAAAVFRLLETSGRDSANAHNLRAFGQAQLNHAERKAAQFWLWRRYKTQSTATTRAVILFWLFRLHPSRALKLMLFNRE